MFNTRNKSGISCAPMHYSLYKQHHFIASLYLILNILHIFYNHSISSMWPENLVGYFPTIQRIWSSAGWQNALSVASLMYINCY
jgi:hypothetical protein